MVKSYRTETTKNGDLRIAVYIRREPQADSVQRDRETGAPVCDAKAFAVNDCDKSAIEAALRLRDEAGGNACISAFCTGPASAEKALREALAMGCDAAYRIEGDDFLCFNVEQATSDAAAAMAQIGFDLILTGSEAVDAGIEQMGTQLAERLTIPQVSCAAEIAVHGGNLTVKSRYDETVVAQEVETPCLVTALRELAEPRYLRTDEIIAAYEKEIVLLPRSAVGGELQNASGNCAQNTPGGELQNAPGACAENTPGGELQNASGACTENTSGADLQNTPGHCAQGTHGALGANGGAKKESARIVQNSVLLFEQREQKKVCEKMSRFTEEEAVCLAAKLKRVCP